MSQNKKVSLLKVVFLAASGFFLFVCMVIRSSAVYLAYKRMVLKPLGVLYIIFGLGMSILYIFNLRKTGLETGGKIWWIKQRPVFALIYLLFGFLAIQEKPYAWKVLMTDIIFGLAIFIKKRFVNLLPI